MLKFFEDDSLKNRLIEIVSVLDLSYVDLDRVFCVRSTGSTAKRVRARCWGLPRVWQETLGLEPAYVIEVLSDYFDSLSLRDQDYLLIHELLHIPQTFSGALRNHQGSRGELVGSSVVKEYYDAFLRGEPFSKRLVKSYSSVDYVPAVNVNQRLSELIESLGFGYVDSARVNCVFSLGTNTSFHARSWSFPRLWQQVLGFKPHYLIELVKHNFESLSFEYQTKLLIKELLFIPKSFSGALKNQRVGMRQVNKLYNNFVSREGLSWV